MKSFGREKLLGLVFLIFDWKKNDFSIFPQHIFLLEIAFPFSTWQILLIAKQTVRICMYDPRIDNLFIANADSIILELESEVN